jgi:exodeoxyribonuclease V alpha subunit
MTTSPFVSAPGEVDLTRVGIWIDRFTQKRDITLSAEQRRAVELAASSRLLVLTGGPGCGKTFTTRTIVALWRAMRKSILLAASTGRAAQRLAEMTHVEAKTVHHLLAFDPKTMHFRHDEDNPLEAEAIVVDETSMLDLFLAHSLCKAIPSSAQVLLVGDIDQLPSVGPGIELSLAWAVTIHKSQGSEYPVVILPLFMHHYLLLSRNLLYTGLTGPSNWPSSWGHPSPSGLP